jgi:hypothetical protein
MAMLRPGIHFHNGCKITAADVSLVRRWSPLSLMEAMDGVVNDEASLLRGLWDEAGRPPVVLRRYYTPRTGGPAVWGAHAGESMELAQKCVDAGIPAEYLMLKPFNEPNMPEWAQWEGFGDDEDAMKRYNEALLTFINAVRAQMPAVRVGGPHLTVGNRDVRFPNDPQAVYYYHGADGKFSSSPCAEALSALDVHFVHCYGFAPGEYAKRAYGLRFLEYEKYLTGKDIYVVEGAYGINSGQAADVNTVRGEETAAYLKLLGEKYPQVKGVALWIGGDPHAGWFAFCHANGPGENDHRPVVYAVESAGQSDGGEDEAEPGDGDEETEAGVEDLDTDGLSDEMVEGLEVTSAARPSEGRWRVTRVEVQPGTDNMSAYAVVPAGSGCMARFSWPDGFAEFAPKADPLAPEGAREWAASMPMFGAWGSYAVEIVGNSEKVSGLGLYGAGLEVGYTDHHPVLVYFERVTGSEPEEEPEEQPDEEPEEPMEEDKYSLMRAFPKRGIEDVVDARPEIESFSDQEALQALWRPFSLIRLVVVHHSGSDLATQTPLTIARYRVLEKGDPTIPYHFCVDLEGRLWFTARLCWELPNSGKSATNAESVSVCVLGDFREHGPTAKQLDTLRRLVWWVVPEFLGGGWGQYRGVYVIPHGRLVATACPGSNLVDALVWEGSWPDGLPFRAGSAGE